jgi:dUTP pyrophosphatase
MTLSLQVKYLRSAAKGKLHYATKGSAGLDLVSAEEKPVLVGSIQHVTVHTGISVAIPEGFVGILAPRSSLGRKGLSLANTIGIIDSDYRGEILVDLVVKQGKPWVQINPGDRFVQLLLIPVLQCNIEEVQDLPDTARGAGGFGSTG